MTQLAARKVRHQAMGLAVITSLVSKGGNILLMLVSVPLAFRVLGEERFGVYGVVQTMIWFITMSDLGMGPGVTRRIATAVARGDRAAESASVSGAFFITAALALLTGGALAGLLLTVPVTALFGEGFAPMAGELEFNLWLAGGMFLLMLPVNILERCREGFQEIHIGNAFGAAQNMISAGLLFFGIYRYPNVSFLLLSIYGVQCLTMSANAAWLIWKRPWLLPRWSAVRPGLARVLVAEGLALYIAGSVAPILQREGTKWMLGQQEGPAAVGRLTIMVQLGFFLFGFVYMLSRPLWPAVADAVARGDLAWVRGARKKVWQWFGPFASLTVGGFIFLGPWAADRWLGKAVYLPRWDFALFSLSLVLMVWSHLHYVMLAGSGSIRRPAVLLGLETVLVLVLSWLGIQTSGLSGGLAGTVAGSLLLSAWWLPRMLQQRLKALMPAAALPAADPDAVAPFTASALLGPVVPAAAVPSAKTPAR